MSKLKIGDLVDCAACVEGMDTVDLDLSTGRQMSDDMKYVPRRPPRPRKPRSKGKGPYCVISHKGRTVHCYEDKATAKRVASAFTNRGKAGTKFTVKER